MVLCDPRFNYLTELFCFDDNLFRLRFCYQARSRVVDLVALAPANLKLVCQFFRRLARAQAWRSLEIPGDAQSLR